METTSLPFRSHAKFGNNPQLRSSAEEFDSYLWFYGKRKGLSRCEMPKM